MRLRHIQGAEEAIASSPFVIQEPESHRGCWNQVFGNENPIEIEVGMGKGRFIMEKPANPHINYIGIERYSSVLLRGLQKRSEIELSNLYFMCIDAKSMADLFAPGEVSRILSELFGSMAQRPTRKTPAHIPCFFKRIRSDPGPSGNRRVQNR